MNETWRTHAHPLAPCRHRRPVRSLLALGLGLLLALAACAGVTSLQSSVNPAGLGTMSLAAMTTIYAGSLLLLAGLRQPFGRLLERVGCRLPMAASLVLCTSYVWSQTILEAPSNAEKRVVAQRHYLMAVAWTSGVAAFGAAVATHVGVAYVAGLLRERPDLAPATLGVGAVVSRLAVVVGNMVSSLVLTLEDEIEGHREVVASGTNLISSCGRDFYPGELYVTGNANPLLDRPSPVSLERICGTLCLFLWMAALTLLLGVEEPVVTVPVDEGKASGNEKKVEQQEVSRKGGQGTVEATTSRAAMMAVCWQAPLWISLGMSQAFFDVDFTLAYVTCSLGLRYVGWVMMSLGWSECVGVVVGLHALVSRGGTLDSVSVHAAAAFLQLAVVWRLLFAGEGLGAAGLFACAAAFGLGQGILLTVNIPGTKVCWGALLLLRLLGLAIGYFNGVHLSTAVKLYLLAAATVCGLLARLAREVIEVAKSGQTEEVATLVST